MEKFIAIATLLARVVASVPADVAFCVVGAPAVYGFSAVAGVLAIAGIPDVATLLLLMSSLLVLSKKKSNISDHQ